MDTTQEAIKELEEKILKLGDSKKALGEKKT